MEQNMGKVIQAKRRAKGMTQEQLAQLVGVSSAAVSKWETASALPDVALLCPLARALDCTPDELLDFKPQLTEQEVDTLGETAECMFQAGKWQKAWDFCEGRLREYPGDLYLAFRCGGLYAKYLAVSGQEEQASRQLRRAIQLMERACALTDEESQRAALLSLAGLYVLEDRLDDAMATLDRLPGCNQDAQNMRASILLRQGKLDEAEQLETANLSVHLHNAQLSLLGLANIAKQRGDRQKQLELLDRIDRLIEQFPNPEGGQGIGRVASLRRVELYAGLGRWSEAQRETERFVADTIRAPEGDCGGSCPSCGGEVSRAFLMQNALQMLSEANLPPQLTESLAWRREVERLEQAVHAVRAEESSCAAGTGVEKTEPDSNRTSIV